MDVQHIPLNTPPVLNALSAAALANNLHYLDLKYCNFSPASVPALARLIRGGVLKLLQIDNEGIQLLDEVTAVQLADAVAASRALTGLTLKAIRLWHDAALLLPL